MEENTFINAIYDDLWCDVPSDCGMHKVNPEALICDRCGLYDPWGDFQHWFNIWMVIILVVGLILWPYLINRKHKWEKWLWKKCLLWDLLFFLIVVIIWFIISYIVWRIRLHEMDPYLF